jgi:hypothetical protein
MIGLDGYLIGTTTNYSGAPLYLGDREHFVRSVSSSVRAYVFSKPVRLVDLEWQSHAAPERQAVA